ncbi:DNA-binding MarR family transcriptional regulator [Paenibacillus shirakamiensis]|uniref:DNA-binding MarR family transcriptional regulator n=1 Tax=Paenibacillus shirakamiensis TaxID=1265935 RepID=A0ABS4JNF6_9BACL|nr:MarR family transcriptional regulator [Paenibacillus shirakamiensis]MBP2002154.1 DNA-binding MarR family transcriptional regulator [Paenibacillus shirakamiensis]
MTVLEYDDYIDRIETSWKSTVRKIQSIILHHKDLGLTGPQYHMLAMINAEKSCNISFLADKIDVKPSAITVMIDRLVQSGYVERRHDKQDRRAVLVSVTPLGEEVYKEASSRSREIMKWYLEQLEEHEVKSLTQIFEKFDAMERPVVSSKTTKTPEGNDV